MVGKYSPIITDYSQLSVKTFYIEILFCRMLTRILESKHINKIMQIFTNKKIVFHSFVYFQWQWNDYNLHRMKNAIQNFLKPYSFSTLPAFTQTFKHILELFLPINGLCTKILLT